jgi:outer membrane receptor protein involved in Fe transport
VTPPPRQSGARRLAIAAACAAIALSLLAERSALAQRDIEIPTVMFDPKDGAPYGSDTELDLTNIVLSAARGVTTVQEAPLIVTVINEEEIRARGFQDFEQILDTVPGWMRTGGIHSQFPSPLSRGTVQAVLFMHNGVSLFDPLTNVPAIWRVQPLETIKHVEMITGPGGVLWGANSYMGILNIITKEAEDVDGVEVGGMLGGGPGDRNAARAYAMVGMPRLGDGWKLFLHGSFETYQGPTARLPNLNFAGPLPLPNGPNIYGPMVASDQKQSMVLNLSGKLTHGAASLSFQLPFVRRYLPLGFLGLVAREEIEEDSARDPATGELLCPFEPPFYDGADMCLDKGRVTRDNRMDWFDRYVVAEYRKRLDSGKAGFIVKAYGSQFVRHFTHFGVLSPLPVLLEGGLSFEVDPTSYRIGTSMDGDIELPRNARLLYGAEAFREWMPDRTQGSRQGPGAETDFTGPYYELFTSLPTPCPREVDPASPTDPRFVAGCPLTFIFESSRSVLGLYANPRWQLTRELILDGGVRLQVAPPQLGKFSFPLTPIFSAALVYNFWPGWHMKVNYAEGFRPPVFINLAGNQESVQVGGDPDLELETSQSAQGEINARLFKGERRIRELTFRADYSYSRLQNLIQIVGGSYQNTADRGIHSAELLAKLYVRGGHRLELGYTFLRVETQDVGRFRAVPDHWFNVSGLFNLVTGRLEAMFNLHVLGSMEDANRLVDVRGLRYDELGRVVDASGMSLGTGLTVDPHELVMDRLPAAAELTLGITWMPTRRLSVSGHAYNAFNGRYYQPDVFYSLEPRAEYMPNPYEDVRVQLRATYQY